MILAHPSEFVRGLDERELTNPEGAGFDLRVDRLWTLSTVDAEYLSIAEHPGAEVPGSLTVETRRTPLAQEYHTGPIGWAGPDDGYYYLVSGRYYLITTLEEVQVPEDALGLIWPRTTLMRSGVTLETGVVNPGYHGRLTMGIHHHGPGLFRLQPGARFCHILFFGVMGATGAYRGQWQGGRISQPEDEVQV